MEPDQLMLLRGKLILLEKHAKVVEEALREFRTLQVERSLQV